GDPRREVQAALERYAGVRPVAMVPEDRVSFDVAMARGQTLAEAVPGSRARLELRELAAWIAGVKPSRPRRRLSLYPSR
ncbi:MAG TPA: hypothetical protein VG708_04970, partial [Mycobacteriales bacterium]|nr:hypothetical protein [Mycobacteriales bacterium]